MGPRTAFLHIGTPKTGTTSIQNWLTGAQRNGDLGPVCYPLYRNDINQSRLIAFYRPDHVPGWMRSEFPVNDARFRTMQLRYHRVIFDKLRRAPGAILSAEALSQFTAAEVRRLRIDLEAAGFRHFHVVLYIRDPADFYLSLVQERLKSTVEPPLVPDPFEFAYQFGEMAKTWDNIFPGSLIVRPFLGGAQHDVIDDFGRLLEEQMGVHLPRIPLRFNTTLSAEGMQIVQDFRRHRSQQEDGVMTPDADRLLTFLQRSTTSPEQTKPILKDAVAQQIRARHSADAAMIARRYGMDLGLGEAHLPDEPSVRPPTGRVEDILDSVDADIVYQLLLTLARSELVDGSPNSFFPLRAAARAYRRLPPEWRAGRFHRWLRSLPIPRDARLGR